MSVLWIAIGLALVAAIARAVWPLRRAQELGSVSQQWLAEQRLSQMSTHER